MSNTNTHFDVKRPHVHLEIMVKDFLGEYSSLDAILDSGASRSEFSNKSLEVLGLKKGIENQSKNFINQQTFKTGKILLPGLIVCGRDLGQLEVFCSDFEASWKIDALIGLDFFRKFKTTIDYSKGEILTEDYS